MVDDQEPRYRLVDADGTVVGSLFAESDGTLKLQEGTSGNDNELSLTTQGALEAEQGTVTSDLNVGGSVDHAPGGGAEQTAVTRSIADDSVITVDAARVQVIFVLINGPTGIFRTNFDAVKTVSKDAGMSNQGTTTLSGTTGPDGLINVSRDANTLYVENRRDKSRKLVLHAFGRGSLNL